MSQRGTRFTASGSASCWCCRRPDRRRSRRGNHGAESRRTVRARSAISYTRPIPGESRDRQQWLPLEPGMQYTPKGKVKSADGSVSAHWVVHTVTGLTKVIHGVATLVISDRDYSDGELADPNWRSSPIERWQRLAVRGVPGGVSRTASLWVRRAPLSAGGEVQARIRMPGIHTRTPGIYPGLCAQGRIPGLRRRLRKGPACLRAVRLLRGRTNDRRVNRWTRRARPPAKVLLRRNGLVQVTAAAERAGDHGPGQDPEAQRGELRRSTSRPWRGKRAYKVAGTYTPGRPAPSGAPTVTDATALSPGPTGTAPAGPAWLTGAFLVQSGRAAT